MQSHNQHFFGQGETTGRKGAAEEEGGGSSEAIAVRLLLIWF